MTVASILDPIQSTLSPLLWDDPGAPEPTLKPRHAHFIKRHIYSALERHGYAGPQHWLRLILTGSLTTFQYGHDSDCDVSLFIDSKALPEWSRAEMIGIMVQDVDGTVLPTTPYPLQDFVVGQGISPADLYRQGLRSGYDIDAGRWIVPPEKDRSHDVEAEENGFYVYALQMADKMERLLRYEPEKAAMFWHQLHSRRQRDQAAGRGDYSESNIIYKFLAQRNLLPALAELTGEHIARGESPFAVTVRTMRRDGYSDDEIESWANYLADHNEADRDSGELDDVPDEQVERWYENWESEGRPRIATWKMAAGEQQMLDQNAGQDLQGLPGPVNVPGYGPLQFHAHRGMQQMAESYNRQHGIQSRHPTDYVEVQPHIAQQVADEFDRAPHNPNDPAVQDAYGAFARETLNQYNHTINHGYRFEYYPTDRDPYPNSPREAVLDLHHNKHMYVFPSSSGYVAEGTAGQDHPMLRDSGVRWNGQAVPYNDLFRAIHDVYGHAKEGVGFRANGEENAFRQHAAMYSPLAQRALATDTRGANSWINYGPHGEHNQTATVGDTVFAPNRATLLPEWAGDPNLHQTAPGVVSATIVPPIRAHELSSPTAIERGRSRPVTPEAWNQIAAAGQAQYEEMSQNQHGTEGLDANWPQLQEHAWQSVQQPWGGATINAATGQPLEGATDQYALTARPPGMEGVSIPTTASREQFMAAMNEARQRYGDILPRANHHLGIFHDQDTQRYEFDPVVVVNSLPEAEAIGAHTRALGGAYHFKSGEGFWPPHVPE